MSCVFGIIVLTSSGNSGVENPASYSQHPPIPTDFWVQKVANSADGEAIMIMRVKYISDYTLPTEIYLFGGGQHTNTLKDDGAGADITEGDGIYACYMTDDAEAFADYIDHNYELIQNRGYVSKSVGNTNHTIKAADVTPFNRKAFDNNEEVHVESLLIDPQDCIIDIKKQNSLFITDLDVVEDLARTYNFTGNGSGNIIGEWTFGSLMSGLIGPLLRTLFWLILRLRIFLSTGSKIGCKLPIMDLMQFLERMLKII